jgi:sensor histidine kinase YesM
MIRQNFFAQKGIDLAARLNIKDTLAKFYRFKGVSYSRTNKYEQAIDVLNKAIEINIELKDYKSQAKNTNSIGATYYRKGNTQLAIEYYLQALGLAKEINYDDIISTSLNNLGAAHKKNGDYMQATEYLIQALEIAQNSNSKYNEAQALGNLAQCYAVAGNLDLSNKYYQREKAIKEDLKDYKGLINIHINMGVNYSSQNKKDSALYFYNKALAYAQQLDNRMLLAILYSNIAAIYNYKKKHDTAIVLLKRAYSLNKELKRTKGLINTSINLAGSYKDLKQYEKTEYYFNEALHHAVHSELKPEMLNLYNSLSSYYALVNNFAKAYEYKNYAYQLSDTLMNAEVAGKMEELQVRYETEKKERRIEELLSQQKIAELAAQKSKRNFLIIVLLLILAIGFSLFYLRQKQLAAKARENALGQKLLRTQMNPHFIFNSLNSISAFIGLKQSAEAQLFLSRFAKLMRNILESSKNEYISLEKEIEIITHYLQLENLRHNQGFEFEIILSDNIEADFIEVPPMLIQPFLENAIQHGLRNIEYKGSVKVYFTLLANEVLHCRVCDNGIGINQAQSDKKHKSYAMEITRERLAILNRKQKNKINFKVSDLHETGGRGTAIELFIPLC